MLHDRVLAVLKTKTEDTGQLPGYWSVGYEARAMIENLDPEHRKVGEEERSSVLTLPGATPDLMRWAGFYATPAPDNTRIKYVDARYRYLC